MENSSLAHHGILGMKWGVRRYQNKDGSLTQAGKKRLGYSEDSKKTEKKSHEKPVEKKKISEMTDEELASKIRRNQLERTAYELDRQISSYNPKHVSAGEKFFKSLGGNVIAPAAKEAGRDFMTKFLKAQGNKYMEKMGLDTKEAKSIIDELKDEFTVKDYRAKIRDIDNRMKKEQNTKLKDLEEEYKVKNYEKKIAEIDDYFNLRMPPVPKQNSSSSSSDEIPGQLSLFDFLNDK